MSTHTKSGNAVGGKTARACDSCLRNRSRWYCAADDAYLCQECDASVHSANPLARRHERVRLKLNHNHDSSMENSLPAWHWHQGFTRKPRTPRHGKSEKPLPNQLCLVPEIGSDAASPDDDENEEKLLYRVPIFDPFVAEFCTSPTSHEVAVGSELKVLLPDYEHDRPGEFDHLHGFLPSDMDLAEFAADVESLLGRGLDENSFCMEGLGLLDCKEEDNDQFCFESGRIKVEEVEEEDIEVIGAAYQFDPELDMTRETLDLNFDCDSPTTGDEEEKKVVAGAAMARSALLRLDYKAVITAWATQGSPWTTGDRPKFNSDEFWPDCMDACPTDVYNTYRDVGGVGAHVGVGDEGREARVSRYREKRRTRLFSKKIRYEVRKLNAEKRPRMKGRFVKRASSSFAGPVFSF
ncbi:hypothetical protein HHK36_014995 [Tetracentron sinense]|uniref:Uncharacterized protein n=1 Tax=Tetracentron sinense TaxID=13715 RepID=A0A834Z3X0_TETSI|nr:hypothetical protein HHK36_014995 [Tetracentron sinense]